jgi:hypothetical protein
MNMSKKSKNVLAASSLVAMVATVGLCMSFGSHGTESRPELSDNGAVQHAPAGDAMSAKPSGSASSMTSTESSTTTSSAVQTDAAKAQATSVFRTSKQCLTARKASETMQRQIKACESAPAGSTFKATCERNTAGFSAKVATLSSTNQVCGGDADGMSETSFYADVVKAADAGDPDAQMCFIGSDFNPGHPWTKDEVAAYKDKSNAYAEAAFARGDWRVVQAKMTSERVLAHTRGLLPFFVDTDPASQYRMNRLARLGATGSYAAQLDANAAEQTSMSAKDRKDADAWAQQMYAQHFAGSPALTQAPSICD